FLHLMMECGNVSGDVFAPIIICHESFVTRAREMNYLQRHAVQERQGLDQRLINSAGTLASSHHQQRRKVFLKPEFPTCKFAVQAHKLGSDGSAGDFRMCFWKKRGAFLKPE